MRKTKNIKIINNEELNVQTELNFLSSIKPTNDIENIFIIESQLFRNFHK